MTQWVKEEIKKANKEKKRCQKTYSDWKDDEFNMGPLKFVYAIQSNEHANNPSFNTLNDLVVSYNRDTNKYVLEVDLDYVPNDKIINHLGELLDKFQDFVQPIKLRHITPIDFVDVLYKMPTNACRTFWVGESLLEVYLMFYVFVKGYTQCVSAYRTINK